MKKMRSFKDKEVLITGAGSGIGRETALAFARKGARLWLSDVNEMGNEETARLVRQQGAVARTLHCNVADAEAVASMAEKVHREIEALDILMNNAGIGSAGQFLDTSLATWRKVMDVNFMGVVHGCHAFLPKMVQRRQGGHIINTASAAAFVAAPDMPIYAASKFAVRGFTESLRADMAKYGIGVTAVCPGIINTPIIASTIMEGQGGAAGKHDKAIAFYKKRNYTPKQVAEVILEAVRKNVGVQPVSPEAWGMYYAKRFLPGLVGKLVEREMPFP